MSKKSKKKTKQKPVELQNKHPPMMLRLKYDAAQTTPENARHWAMADGLSADGSMTPEIRRTLRNRARLEVANNAYARGMVLTLNGDIFEGEIYVIRKMTLKEISFVDLGADPNTSAKIEFQYEEGQPPVKNEMNTNHAIDFLIAAVDLPLVPLVGDQIISGNIVHEVIDLGDNGCWSWCDPHGIRRRIHTSIFKEH